MQAEPFCFQWYLILAQIQRRILPDRLEIEKQRPIYQPRLLVTTINLKKLLQQQLRSLQTSGLQAVPRSTDDDRFDFSAGEPQSSPDRSATSVTSATPVKPKTESVAKTTSPSAPATESTNAQPNTSTSDRRQPLIPDEKYPQPIHDMGERQSVLAVVEQEVAQCRACPELCGNRTKTVFGVGNPGAKIVFLGEGPGADEDAQGVPFVGASGQLLDKIFAASKLSRDEIYILNTVKCRPPNNRNPTETEIQNCWGYLHRQLETIQPEIIVCLGSVAARSLLQTTLSLGKLRQKFHSYRGSRVLVTYHPAYLLRNANAKRLVWDDMKMLMREFGVEL